MKFTSFLAAAAATLATHASAAIIPRSQGSLPPITTEGNKFMAGGKRWHIRGVAYQPGGASDAKDPLLDIESLKRDIEQFKTLGINCIRIYTIDNSQNHDEAMKMLDDAGIYLALDANTPKYSLNRADLASLHASYVCFPLLGW
jgi:1,3-beta-glucanosyltransferase GAS5